MPVRSKKPCKKLGCKNLVEYPNRYCIEHKELEEKEKVEGNKFYDNTIRRTRDGKYTKFYHSKEWDKVKKLRLTMDHGLCQHCLEEDKITLADVVHHIIEVKGDWEKRLAVDNLISLCHSCHNKIHGCRNNKL